MNNWLKIISVAAIALPSIHFGETAEEKGYAIAARSDRSDRGFGDSEVDLQMILKTKSGRSTTRELEIKTLELSDEKIGDKSLVVFSKPRDVNGTALLSHAKILDPDDQWLYLPALKRVKRISSVNKSGPFVGSEFAFEDLTAQELGKYDYKYIEEGEAGGLKCDVIQRIPKYEHSGYTKQIAWVDQSDHQVRKIEFYDRKDSKLKTLEFLEYKKYNGKFWRAQKMTMINHQTGKSTDLVYGDYKFSVGLKDSDFVSTSLSRTR
ncbi:MAG: outer membrane lipoprotein-sorting protein [Verrucomicrobiota bacterium]